jgi:hypothetical protein
MKKFYFVGGPKTGQSEEFFRRLSEIGGPPPGWRIYPHAVNDGKALHIVEAQSPDEILVHLHHFDGIYEQSEIVEIVEPRP